MPDAGGDMVNCEEIQSAIAQRQTLSLAESAHVEVCEACLEVWLDATVVEALNTKPQAPIPANFAARVVAGLPEKRDRVRELRGRERHWGLAIATLLVAVGLVAAALVDPGGLNSRMGLIFMALVVSEIAGIGLWLGAWLQR